MFSVIPETVVSKEGESFKFEYGLMAQNDTTNMAKSPADMFTGTIIPNDMKAVLAAICKYEDR